MHPARMQRELRLQLVIGVIGIDEEQVRRFNLDSKYVFVEKGQLFALRHRDVGDIVGNHLFRFRRQKRVERDTAADTEFCDMLALISVFAEQFEMLVYVARGTAQLLVAFLDCHYFWTPGCRLVSQLQQASFPSKLGEKEI